MRTKEYFLPPACDPAGLEIELEVLHKILRTGGRETGFSLEDGCALVERMQREWGFRASVRPTPPTEKPRLWCSDCQQPADECSCLPF